MYLLSTKKLRDWPFTVDEKGKISKAGLLAWPVSFVYFLTFCKFQSVGAFETCQSNQGLSGNRFDGVSVLLFLSRLWLQGISLQIPVSRSHDVRRMRKIHENLLLVHGTEVFESPANHNTDRHDTTWYVSVVYTAFESCASSVQVSTT